MPSGLSESVGTSFGPLGSYAFAAVVVLALILIVLFVAKRAAGRSNTVAGTRKGPRLAVIDVAPVDQRRKLVLVRRDEVEHLVLIGGENDLVVEGGIVRAPAGSRSAPEMGAMGTRAYPATAIAPEPRARPVEANGARAASPLRRVVPNAQRAGEEPLAREAEAMPPLADDRDSGVSQRGAGFSTPTAVSASQREAVSPVHPSAVRPDQPPIVSAPQARVPVPEPAPAEKFPAADRASRVAIAAEEAKREVDAHEPQVPQFLRRSAEPPRNETPMASRPPEIPAVSIEPQSSDPGGAPLRHSEPTISVFGHPDQQPARVQPPVRPTAPPQPQPRAFQPPVLGPSEPVPASNRTTAAPISPQPTPRGVPPVSPASAEPVAAPAVDPVERQPLSVRSFASTIQSRRTVDAPRPETTPQPAVQATPSFPRREPDSDDALARGLDDDFRAVDWSSDGDGAPRPQAPLVKPDVPATAQAPAAATKRPTLEEEMARLLGDFDLNTNKR